MQKENKNQKFDMTLIQDEVAQNMLERETHKISAPTEKINAIQHMIQKYYRAREECKNAILQGKIPPVTPEELRAMQIQANSVYGVMGVGSGSSNNPES